MKKSTVICVDDDAGLQTVVSHYLEDQGYKVLSAHNGAELEEHLQGDPADAILLDLMLPDSQGLDLITKIRARTAIPIIIVSGRSDTTEKIVGLEMGADDYLTKPFEMRELSARLKAVLRRASADTAPAASNESHSKGAEKIKFADWVLDRTRYEVVTVKGQTLDFTMGEFRLLEALLLSANRALSREQLFEITRDGEFDAYDRAIDIQIARIRKKLGDDPKSLNLIKTVRGVGYMFCGDVETAV